MKHLNLILLVIIILILGWSQFKPRESDHSAQNLIALNDTIREFRDQWNQYVSERSSYVTGKDIEELQKWNRELYDELKKEMGDVKSLTRSRIVVVRTDTIWKTRSERINDSTWVLTYNNRYEDSSLTQKIELKSKIRTDGTHVNMLETNMVQNETQLKIKLVHTVENDTVKVKASSLSPFIKFSELDAYTMIPVHPKENRFIVGPYVGIGIGKGGFQPQIGLGVTYNLNRTVSPLINRLKK